VPDSDSEGVLTRRTSSSLLGGLGLAIPTPPAGPLLADSARVEGRPAARRDEHRQADSGRLQGSPSPRPGSTRPPARPPPRPHWRPPLPVPRPCSVGSSRPRPRLHAPSSQPRAGPGPRPTTCHLTHAMPLAARLGALSAQPPRLAPGPLPSAEVRIRVIPGLARPATRRARRFLRVGITR
jgi:hypothetical protein